MIGDSEDWEQQLLVSCLLLEQQVFSTCLNIVLRGKGLGEEELVLWEDEELEFICCCCATAIDGSINLLNGIVIIIATANTMAVASNRFLIGVTVDNSSNLFLCIEYTG